MSFAEQLGYRDETERQEFALGSLELLETFSRRKLSSKDEIAMWTRRLSQYPKDVLLTLGGYTGHFSNDVFHYLDEELRMRRSAALERNLPKLPDRSRDSKLKKMARITFRYTNAILSGKYDHKQMVYLEWKFVTKNRKRWPDGNWQFAFRENRDRESAERGRDNRTVASGDT